MTPSNGPEASATPRGLADWLELTKPRLSALVIATTAVGYVIAAGASVGRVGVLLVTVLATTLVVAGANTLNQVQERVHDALMTRTRHRPLPAGRLHHRAATFFGWALGGIGVALLALLVNPLAAGLAAAGFALYAFVYTPLKRRTRLCTLVGAVPGAIPPIIGWAAARGSLDASAAALFTILFLWQIPHFLAIARLYREDYAAAGMRMLGLTERGQTAYRTMVAFCLLLLPAGASLAWTGVGGSLYLWGSLALGLLFLAAAIRASLAVSRTADRLAFFASLVYLSGLLVLLLVDRTG